MARFITCFTMASLVATLFSSCGGSKTELFTSQKYTNYNHHSHLNYKKSTIEKQSSTVYASTNANDVMPALATEKSVYNHTKINTTNQNKQERISRKELKKDLQAQITRLQKKPPTIRYFTETKNSTTSSNINNDPTEEEEFWLEVILSFLIPPLAVYLHTKEIGNFFWISVLLTILFWIPGIVFAILIVTNHIK